MEAGGSGEHMAGFNRGTIISTAVHEVYPGHYTQFLWVPMRLKGAQAAGMQFQCRRLGALQQQMMLDEGYGRTRELIRTMTRLF